MYLKAKTFSDAKIMRLIIQADNSADAKKLGREVSGFNEKIWRKPTNAFCKQYGISLVNATNCLNFCSQQEISISQNRLGTMISLY